MKTTMGTGEGCQFPSQQANECTSYIYSFTYSTCHKLPFYARATGTGMGIARVCVRAQQGYGYRCARSTATGVSGVKLQA